MAKPPKFDKVPTIASMDDLATVLDLSRKTILQLTNNGILRRVNGSGSGYMLAASVQSYVKFRESVVAKKDHTGGAGDYGRARTKLYSERAEVARIKREELMGLTMPIEEAKENWGRTVIAFRNRVLGMPVKIAPQVVMLKTAAEAQAIIDAECREVLEDISNAEIKHDHQRDSNVSTRASRRAARRRKNGRASDEADDQSME